MRGDFRGPCGYVDGFVVWADRMKSLLIKVGWWADFNVPVNQPTNRVNSLLTKFGLMERFYQLVMFLTIMMKSLLIQVSWQKVFRTCHKTKSLFDQDCFDERLCLNQP